LFKEQEGGETVMTPEVDRLLSTSEAARYLGVREQLLVTWRYENRGPAFHRLGRLVRYSTDELAAWVEEQRVAPGA